MAFVLASNGDAAAAVRHILEEARRRGYGRLSLETGAQRGFEAARQLYAHHGFSECAPFADYTDDPNSVFLTKEI